MDTSILLAVAACLLAIFLKWWFSASAKLPPGPFGLPIVGYLPFLSRKAHLDLYRLSKKYGNVFSLYFGSQRVVVLTDFESTREAFTNDAFGGRPPEIPVVQNKESRETGAFLELPWKDQRRFALHMLRDLGLGKTKLEEHIKEEISELLEHLEKHCNTPYSIVELLAPSMSNNIASLVFGKRYKYDHPTRKMMTRILNESASSVSPTAWTLFFPWLKKAFRFFGITRFNKITEIQKELRDFIRKEIDEHEKTLDPNNIRDFIDGYLVEIKNRKGDPAFCKPVLQDLVAFFFGAGSETVRISVEWLLLTASTHRDAQRRIQHEIDDVIGRSQFPNWAHQKSMPYTEAFIMEVSRWKNIVPINLLRYTLKDGEIGGYRIPKGTVLMNNLWAIHHDPEYWGRDADEFRPERFLTDDGLKVKKWDHYAPFSIGKRACPGEPMAKVEVFLYLTSILQQFDVKYPDGKTADFEGVTGLGMRPKPQELIFTKRN